MVSCAALSSRLVRPRSSGRRWERSAVFARVEAVWGAGEDVDIFGVLLEKDRHGDGKGVGERNAGSCGDIAVGVVDGIFCFVAGVLASFVWLVTICSNVVL